MEPVWVERGCSYFFEATYLLTRRAPTVATSPPEGGDEALDEVDPRCLGTIINNAASPSTPPPHPPRPTHLSSTPDV